MSNTQKPASKKLTNPKSANTTQTQLITKAPISGVKSTTITAKPVETQRKTYDSRSALGRIYEIYDTNPAQGEKLYKDFKTLQSDPTSQYYRQYARHTNRAVDELNALGIDTSKLNSEWISANSGWINNNLLYTGTSNTPSKPNAKKGTKDQWTAYWLYQWDKSEGQTKQAEDEIQKAINEAKYWAGRTELNLSDDEVIGKVREKFSTKYPKLAQMEASSTMAPLEMNRAVDFSDDILYGAAWEGRNPGFKGNIDGAIASSALGKGNQWKYNPEIADKLNPESPNFKPYAIGSTNLDEAAAYFGVDSFSKPWIAEHNGLQFDDTKEGKFMRSIISADENNDEADAAIDALHFWMSKHVGNMSPEDAKNKLDTVLAKGYIKVNGNKVDIGILNRMDKSIGKEGKPGTGDLIPMTRGADYKYADALAEFQDMCAKKAAVGTGIDYVQKNTSDTDSFTTIPKMPGSEEANTEMKGGSVNMNGSTAQIPDQAREILRQQDKNLAEGAELMDEVLNDTERAIFATTSAETAEVNNLWNTITPGDLLWKNAAGTALDYVGSMANISGSRAAYVQAATELPVVQEEIRKLEEQLGELDFDDPTVNPEAMPEFDTLVKLKAQEEKLQKTIADNQSANNEYDQENLWFDATISAYEDAGLDTTELQLARAMSGYLADMSVYQPTVWDTQSFYQNMADEGKTAEEINAQHDTQAELLDNAIFAREYINQNNVEVSDDIRNNLDRYIAALERDEQDYQYYMLKSRDDFAAGVEAGKEREAKEKIDVVGPLILEYGAIGTEMELIAGIEKTDFFQFMNDDEINTYYYLYGTEGIDAAYQYCQHLKDDTYGVLTARQTEKIEEYAQNEVDSGFLGGAWANTKAIASAPLEGVMGLAYFIDRALTGKEYNPNSPYLTFGHYSAKVNEATMKSIKDVCGDGTVGEKLVSGLYEILYNRGRSAMNAAVFNFFGAGSNAIGMVKEFVGAAPMAIGAASMAAADAKERGASDGQAMAIATATFFAEDLSEGLTRSNIMEAFGKGSEITATSIKDALVDWLTSSGLEEMIGESANEIIEKLTDEMVMKELSEHADLVRKMKEDNPGISDEEAEELARRNEIAGMLHTAIISYLSPGIDVAMTAARSGHDRLSFYRQETRRLQKNGYNVSLSEVRKMYNNKLNGAAQETEEAPAVKAVGKPATVSAENTETATDAEQNNVFLRSISILNSVSNADIPTKIKAIASELYIPVFSQDKYDSYDAAGPALFSLFGGDGNRLYKIMKAVIVASRDKGESGNSWRQALTNAALSPSSQARSVLMSEEFQSATPEQKVELLNATVKPDFKSKAVQAEIANSVAEWRIATKEAQIISEGNSLGNVKAAAKTVTKAVVDTQTANERVESAEAEENEMKKAATDAAMLATEEPSTENTNQAAAAMTRLEHASRVTESERAGVEAAEARQKEAEENYRQETETAMNEIRQQGTIAKEQEDVARQEAAEQKRIEDEVRAQAEAAQRETNNVTRMDADDFINRYFPNATDEEKETIRNQFRAIRSEMGMTADALLERGKFARAVSKKFGVNIAVQDTTQGGKVSRQNAYVDMRTGNIVVDTQATMDDMMYAVLVHELTHIAEKSGTYGELADALIQMEYGDDTGRLEADIRARKELYDTRLAQMHEQDNSIDATPLTPEQAKQEIVADLMGKVLSGDQALIDSFVAEQPSLARRILDSIKSFLKKMAGIEGAPISQAQQVVNMLETALMDAKGKQDAENELTKKFKIQEASPYLADQIRNASDILDNMESVKSVSSEVDLSPYYNIAQNKEAQVKLWAKDKADAFGRTLYREGFGEAELSNSAIKTIFSYLGYTNDAAIAAFEALPEVYKYGQEIETHEDHKGRGVESHTFAAPVDINGERGNMGLIVRKSRNGTNFKTYKILLPDGREFTIRNEKAELAPEAGSEEAARTDSVSDEMVTQENPAVKPLVTDNQGNELATELPGGTVAVIPHTKYSLSSFTPEEQQKVRKALLDSGNYTREQVDKYLGNLTGIASVISADRERLDFTADPGKTMLKQNAEYVKTLDASTLCAKRLLYQGTFDAIQHALPNTPLLPEDLIDLANMMRDMGYETPCGICYVESRRRQLGKFTEQWLNSYDGEYKPTIDQVTTSDGLEELRQSHPQAYQDFVSAMNKKGTMNPKVVQLRTDYRGEIRDMTPGQIQKVKDIGGLRIQSFSDFETPHLLDMAQAVMDMAAKKLTAQAYTKVPNFPWAFGDTGIKINLSLIGKGTGLDENGNLVFDDVEGMPFEEAMKLRDRYSQNVGTILVGINDQHILAAMADDRIDFIIPFHKSGWSKEELSKMPVLNSYSDYTDSQNEKKIVGRNKNGTYKTESLEKSKQVNFQPVGENGYWDFNKSGKENAEEYLRMCAEDGRLPKFSQFLVDNGDGSFSLQPDGSTDGYWKTLIDFKMYDNDGNGAPQQEVTPNINMPEAMRILNEYSLDRKGISRKSNNDLPLAQPVVDRYVEEYKANHPGRKYSLPSPEVQEAAEEAFKNSKARTSDGKLMPVFHGTKADFNVFDTSISGGVNGTQEGFGIYLTDNPEIPKQYGGRIISAYVNMERPAYADKKTIKRAELAKVIKATCEKEAQMFVDEGSYDNVNDAIQDTWISNYVYTPEYRSINDAINAVANLILEQNDNDSDIVSELLFGQGIRNYDRAMEFYHNVLTPITGIDGIWAKWTNQQDGTVSNILLAFDSSQIKSNEDVTYDDEGNPIPMGQRFDRSNPDIRYSLPSDAPYMAAVERGEMDEAAKDVKEYAASKGFDTSEKAYHGTPLFGFTRFDMQNSQDEIFVAYNPKTAGTYSFGGEVRDIASTRDRQDVSEMDADTFLDAVKKYIRKRPNSGGHGVISAKYVTADDLANIVSNQENFLKKALYGCTWDQATENTKSTLLNATKNAFGYYDVKSLMEDLRNAKSPLDYLNTYLDYLKNNPYENGNTPWPSNDSMNRGATVENALNILVNNYAKLDNQIWQDYATYATRDIMQAYAGLQKAQNGEPLIAIMSSGKDSSPYTVYYTRSNLEGQVDMQRDIVGDSGIYQFYTRPGNQFVVDAKGALWRNISVPEISDDLLKTRDIAEWARENGYDSVRINNVYDNGGRSGERSDGFGDIGIFFNPMDVKSADTVTRDSDGNIIPLSERFDSYNADFRYSLPSENLLNQQIRQYMERGGSMMEQENLPGNPIAEEGGSAQRQFGRRTAQQSDALHQEVKDYLYTHSSYTPDSNQAQIDRAMDWVQSRATADDPDGYQAAVREVTSDNFDYRSADGQARMLTVMGMAVLKNDLSTELRLADAYNKQGTDLGRQLQARKIFRMMTPIGRQSVLQRMTDQINDDLGRRGINSRVALSDWTLMAAAEAQTEEEFQRVQHAASQELAEQIPANWKDKLRGWRMLSMLGNPRTHIRNIVGNALFVPAVSMKNKLGAVMELSQDKGSRTKTLAPILSKEIRDFAKRDALTMKDALTGEAKYNEDNSVQREQKPFKGLLQAVIDFNSDMLEKEDWTFLKGHYKRALGGWMQANGYTAADMENNPSLLEQGRAYAIQEAQKATYRDFSKLASTLNKVSRDGGVAGFMVDAVLPFKKTPANILKRGIEYSPAGIMKSLTTDLYHLKQWTDAQNGKLNAMPEKAISPNQFIDHLCSGLTGTAIMAVGALLGHAGIVTCGLDDDDDKNKKEQGGQEYSIKFSIAGHDYTYTVDWAAPMAMPFFVGAAIQEQMADQEGFDIEQLVNAFGNITEPVFNLSMLDGVNILLKLSQNNGQESNTTITQILAKVGSNYATSYVPSLMGAIARTVDDKSRKAFVEQGKGNGVLGTFRYAREQTENKIPGLSQTNIPIRDVFGNEKTSSLAERIFENFISPGYIEEYKNDPVLNEMDRLYNANVTDSKDMVPEDPAKSITYKNQKYVLSAEEWDTYKATRGKTAYEMLTDLINSEGYQNADEAAQVQMIKKAWSYADKVGKKAVVPDFDLEEKPNITESVVKEGKVSAYSAGMMKSLADGDYEGYEAMVEALHEEGVEDSKIKEKIGDKYRDQYKDAYKKGDYERMAEIEDILDSSGFDFDLDAWEEQVDKKSGN